MTWVVIRTCLPMSNYFSLRNVGKSILGAMQLRKQTSSGWSVMFEIMYSLKILSKVCMVS